MATSVDKSAERGLRGRRGVLALAGFLLSCGGAAAVPDAGLVLEDAAGSAADATDTSPDPSPDGAPSDGGQPDDGSLDGAQADGGSPDGAQPDGGSPDGAQPDGAPVGTPAGRPAYAHLAETGLYADWATRTVSAGALSFEPTYKLWSDNLTKRRWIALPPGTRIDTQDMDHWVFPVGTKLWKEFSLDGVVLETRLVERYGTGPDDYWMGAFAWNTEQTDAVFVPDGATDVLGTFHDVPPTKDCGACHRGDVGRVLGFSAIQLSRAPDERGPTLRELAAMDLLTAPPTGVVDFPVPGDATTSAALGYLHANCGHCHNLHGTAWPDTQMVLRLEVAERDPAATKLAATAFGQTLSYWRGGAITVRISPGNPGASAVYARMNLRGKEQMPPLATEMLDPTGLATVQAWIASLSPSPPGM